MIAAISTGALFLVKVALTCVAVNLGRGLHKGERIRFIDYLYCAFLAMVIAGVSAATIGQASLDQYGGEISEGRSVRPGERSEHFLTGFVIIFGAMAYGSSTRTRPVLR